MIETFTKIKLVSTRTSASFDHLLNDTLNKMYSKEITIIDIKFGGFAGDAFTALILYKEKES